MSRRRASLSPTLFPFLAVLVCTLGTLILLLALVAVDAEKSAKAAVQEQAQAAVLATEEEVWEAERLIAHRDSQTAQLQRKHGELAHLEDHIRRLRDQLHSLRTEIEAANSSSEDPAAKTSEALAELQKAIESETQRIETLREEHEGRPPRVVIVPYQGTNGTDRRPIYVECTDSAIVIQPEGVRITASALDGPIGPGNPLDAALRAVRTHWQKLDPQAPPPYPLLLVRPDGVHAYATARIAMETWDDQFGYELIPKDLELAFPDPDENLKIQIAQAIDDAILRNQAKLAAGPARWKGFTGPQQGIPGNAIGTGGSRNINNGIHGNNDGNPSARPLDAEFAGNGSANPENVGDFLGARGELSGTGDAPLGNRGPNGLNSIGVPQTGRSPSTFASGNRGSGFGTIDDIQGSEPNSPFGTSSINGSALNTTGTSPNPGELTGDLTEPGTRGGAFPSGGSSEQSLTPSEDSQNGNSPTGSQGNTGSQSNGENASNDALANNSDQEGLGGELGGSESSNFSQQSGALGGFSDGAMASGSADAGAGSSSAMSTDGAPPSLDASGAPTPGMSGPTGSAPFDPHAKTFSEAMNQRQTSAPPNAPKIRPNGMPPSLSSGNNWALPGSVVGQKGATIVRQMEAVVQSDRFILPSDGSRGSETLEFIIPQDNVEEAVLDLGSAIRDRVTKWGPAMLNGRWAPVLHVRVAPGGETRFRQLQTLMRNSGVRVERAQETSR